MRFRFFCLAATLFVAGSAFGQLPLTRIGPIFPSGGQAGTTFEVRLSGEQDLEYQLAPQLIFDHAGLTAEPVVDEAGAWQSNAFRITAAPDVPVGRYEARIAGYYGASQPRIVRIEDRPTSSETADSTPAAPMPLAVDACLYGRIETPADVDDYSFPGEEGRVVVVRCAAASIDSPLQPVLEVTSPDGRRIGFAGGAFKGEALLPLVLPAKGEYRVKVTDASYRGGNDFVYRLEVTGRPVVMAVMPPAGVAGQTAPFVLTGCNLPGGEAIPGLEPLSRTTVEIALPGDPESQPRSAMLNPSQTVVNGFDYAYRQGEHVASPVPVFFASAALVLEAEPNDDSAAPQQIAAPVEIAGGFDHVNDTDRFAFSAKQGDVLYVEAFARRYETPADPVIAIDQISDKDGKPVGTRIATSDDTAENLAPNIFDTLSDDPLIRFEAPSDGTFAVSVRDRYFASRGGPLLAYRLSIRRPAPDFELAIVPFHREKSDSPAGPGSISLRKGENAAVDVYAFRRDGFNGPIKVVAQNLPPGVASKGVTIGEGQTAASLVLTAASDAATGQGSINVAGEATVAGPDASSQVLRHSAHVGTLIRGGATAAVEARLASNLVVSVLDETAPFRLNDDGGAIRVGQGSQVLLPVTVERRPGYAEAIACSVTGLPADAKVTAEVKPFAPELAAQQARLVIDPAAPPRSYQLTVQGTAKDDLIRFPLRLQKAKARQDALGKTFAQADESLRQAGAARDEAAKTVAATDQFAKAASESLTAPSQAALQAAKGALTALEAAAKLAEDLRKQSEAAKQAADKAADEAAKIAAPQKIDYVSPAQSIALTIVPAPVTFQLTVPEDGQVKRGSAIDIKVVVKRQNGFSGPVQLTLSLPPGVQGLSAEPVMIAADQAEGVLHITSPPDAAEGDVLFPAIRTACDHNGEVQIDVPLKLKVVP